MADRQGLLTGRHLSRVQHNAGVVLDWIDRRDREKHALIRLKEALVSSGNWIPEKLFPDRFVPEVVEMPENLDVDLAGGGKAAVDYTDVEWKFGSSAEEEYEELMAQIATLTQGSVTGDQVATRGKDEGWR